MSDNRGPASVHVGRMSRTDIPLVFPLLRLDDPALTPAVWRRRALRLSDPASADQKGVFLAWYGQSSGPCGAAFYAVAGGKKRRFSVRLKPVLTLGPVWPVVRAFALTASRTASELGCEETHFGFDGGDPVLIGKLYAEGFADGAVLLHKNLTFSEVAKN